MTSGGPEFRSLRGFFLLGCLDDGVAGGESMVKSMTCFSMRASGIAEAMQMSSRRGP